MEKGDRLAKSIAQVRSATGNGLELRLYASMQIKDAAESLAPKGEMVVFDVEEGLTVRQPVQSQLLGTLAKCTSLKDLARELNHLENSGFIWIDLVLGVSLTMKDSADVWDAENIVSSVLAPFEWFVQP